MNTNTETIMPQSGSTFAPQVDALFFFIFYTALVLFILVVAGMVYFGIKYRQRGPETQLTSGTDHNKALELIWTIIPTILVIIVFVWGFKTYLTMAIAPRDAMELKVTARKWFWTFDYPEGFSSTNLLTIPVNQPIKLVMSSEDVIHSFFVPDFRVKMDVLPNRYTVVWFEATEPGEADLFCAEYCGKGHSEMLGKVNVVSREDYESWLAASQTVDTTIPLNKLGADLFISKACITCHSIDGSPLIGPTMKNLFGSTVTHQDASTALVDENYLRKSILNPQGDIIQGYPPIMPTFQSLLKDREVDGLIAYIKSLKD